jgi:hypothetical protein
MIRELDTVVLTHDMDTYGLKQGDVGAVVHCYGDGKAFEIEFVTSEGKTIALLTLNPADVRPFSGREVLYAQELAQVAS